jgi:hypothetical protein
MSSETSRCSKNIRGRVDALSAQNICPSTQHIRRPAQDISRAAQYVSRPAQDVSPPAQNISSPALSLSFVFEPSLPGYSVLFVLRVVAHGSS